MLQRSTHHHVVNLGWCHAGALYRLGDDMPAQRLRLCVVEYSAIGPPIGVRAVETMTALRIDVSPFDFVWRSVGGKRGYSPAAAMERMAAVGAGRVKTQRRDIVVVQRFGMAE